MDVIEIIKKDHDRVEELFSRFKGGGGLAGLVRRVTGTVPNRQRRTAVEGICRELDLHARLEEEIFYPPVRSTGDTELGRLIEESLREHARVKELIRELRDGRHEDAELDARVNALEECVQHHVREEENEMLPRVEQLMPELERAKLGRRMQARKRSAAPTRRASERRAGRTSAARRRRTRTTAAPRSARKTGQKKGARQRRSR